MVEGSGDLEGSTNEDAFEAAGRGAEGMRPALDGLVRGQPNEPPTPDEAAPRDDNDALGEP